jgi:hypothetical protein
MASTSRRGRPPCNSRQLDLNFCFNATSEEDSDRDSTMVTDEGRDVDNTAPPGNTSTPDIGEVQLLHHPPRIFKRNFNPKWKIGHTWLYYLKPASGPIAGIIKCEACQEFMTGGAGSKIWGGIGCSTIQISAVKLYKKSDDHKWAFTRWRARHFPKTTGTTTTPIEPALQVMVDREKGRILTLMKLLYFVVYNDQPLLNYIDQCKIHTLLSTPDMPASVEYSSYTNVTAGMGFLSSISQHESLLSEIKLSPVYSILIDESTDRTCEPHLIVYICYLGGAGKFAPCIKFVELILFQEELVK